jgi:hypothetical protein
MSSSAAGVVGGEAPGRGTSSHARLPAGVVAEELVGVDRQCPVGLAIVFVMEQLPK